MEQYIMKGGNPLKGEVTISGAKNAALGILAASIMTDETVTLENLPNVRDIRVLLQAIQEIGATIPRQTGGTTLGRVTKFMEKTNMKSVFCAGAGIQSILFFLNGGYLPLPLHDQHPAVQR